MRDKPENVRQIRRKRGDNFQFCSRHKNCTNFRCAAGVSKCRDTAQIHSAICGRFFTLRWNFFICFFSEGSRSLYVVVRPSVCRLTGCRMSVTFVHPSQAIEKFFNVLRHLVRWTSTDFEVKFYGDRLRWGC